MADTLHLQIITPDKKVVDEQTDQVQILGKNGYLGILPGHAPLITELGIGEISYRENGQSQSLAVAWGFAEVLPDGVTILAETAERAGEIDVRRAKEAKGARRGAVDERNPNVDCARAQCARTRAAIRLEVARRNTNPS